MHELQPLLKKSAAEKAKIKKRSKYNPEKVELYKQSMEVVIEIAEKVLWNKKYRKLGAPELVDLIIKKAEKKGAELSKQQRDSINKKVLQWTIDVADQMQAIDFLVREAKSRADLSEDEVVKLDKEFKILEDEPWQLLATNKLVQREFLEYLPVENKNIDEYEFIVDQTPLVIIKVKSPKDYEEIVFNVHSFFGYKYKNTGGLANRSSFLVKTLPKDLKVFEGKIGLINESSYSFGGLRSVQVVVHEAQHLLYGNYIISEKDKDLAAIDELGAFLKSGTYPYDEKGVFFHETQTELGRVLKRYDPLWLAIKQELLTSQLAGRDPKILYPKVMLADSLEEVLSRLKRVRPKNKKEISLQNFNSFKWCLRDNNKEKIFDISFDSTDWAYNQMYTVMVKKHVFDLSKVVLALDKEKAKRDPDVFVHFLDCLLFVFNDFIRIQTSFFEKFKDLESPDYLVDLRLEEYNKCFKMMKIFFNKIHEKYTLLISNEISRTYWQEPAVSLADAKNKVKKAQDVILELREILNSEVSEWLFRYRVKVEDVSRLMSKYLKVDNFSGLSLGLKIKEMKKLFKLVAKKVSERDELLKKINDLEDQLIAEKKLKEGSRLNEKFYQNLFKDNPVDACEECIRILKELEKL